MSEKTTVGQTSNGKQSHIEQLSWEYLMPKRKERMAGYIRESDPTLADSTTIESQAKAVRQYAEKEGYIYDVAVHEYREAISAYQVPYMEREKLLKMLEAAKRREFDVLAVNEIRAISRRQVEVFIVYDMLQKYGVRLETVKEKFEDDAMGRIILGLRAGYAEIEREQSYQRMQRGKKDRIAIGKAPNGHPKAAYGYIFVDTDRETKGCYEFNHIIIYVDEDGVEWSEYKVMVFIFDLLKEGESLHRVVNKLNDLGIPPPKKPLKGEPHWTASTLQRLLKNRIYIGEVWANRFKRVGKTVKVRPKSEWIRLPDAPSLIDKETFEAIQKQIAYNKQDSLRNNHHKEELGLLRSGYIFCGICGRRMQIVYLDEANGRDTARYVCRQKSGSNQSIILLHKTQIRVPSIDQAAYEKIIATVNNPSWVRAWVRAKLEELREKNQPVVSTEDIEATIEKISQKLQNLYTLAENAPDDEELARITHRMQELGKQKREAEAMLYALADDEEEQVEIEAEIVRFEQWAAKVRPFINDPTYTPTYDDLRFAVRILGIKVTVFPTVGDWPFRYQIDVTVPEIMAKSHYVANDPRLEISPW